MIPRPASIDDAWSLLTSISSTRIGDWPGTVPYRPGDKGFAGKFLESALGIPPGGGDGPDLPDGDLKTYACRPDGSPLYPVQVLQIGSTNVDELILPGALPFSDSRVHRKTRRILLVGIHHGDPDDQRSSEIVVRALVDARPGTYWYGQLEASYDNVLRLFNESIRVGREAMGAQSTVRHGQLAGRWLHIRGKDSQPYTPVFSDFLDDEVSDRQLGFYFEQEFVVESLRGAGRTRVQR
jgi:DNA mismatch repair protein MutH